MAIEETGLDFAAEPTTINLLADFLRVPECLRRRSGGEAPNVTNRFGRLSRRRSPAAATIHA
jgi:hypothetical protein